MGFDDSQFAIPAAARTRVVSPRVASAIDPFARCLETHEDGELSARHGDYRLQTALQPIYSYAHRRPVGYEGLVRARDRAGNPVSPAALLDSVASFDETIFLDRLLRALHVANFSARGMRDAWIFLNINPLVVIHGRKRGAFFREMLRYFDLPPHLVAVEITEAGTMEEEDLECAASYFREIGCLIAIDDFGAGHSNFNRIWKLRPDIIKLDRDMIQKSAIDPNTGRSLARIVGLLHEIGALVVAEGIETEQEALAAVNADVDLLQGYFFARPVVGARPTEDSGEVFERLQLGFGRHMHEEDAAFKASMKPYRSSFAHVSELVSAGAALAEATRVMIRMPSVQRFFLLDDTGTQIGANLSAPGCPNQPDSRHLPVSNARGANWMHRPYFRRAVTNPGTIQITRPYLSIADARMCLTLSMCVETEGGARVLCCDVGYPLENQRT